MGIILVRICSLLWYKTYGVAIGKTSAKDGSC